MDFQDIEAWLVEGGANNPDETNGNPFIVGDANLDGVTDGQDFILWNQAKFTSSTEWCMGNFSGDPVIDGVDFIAWNNHKFMSSGDAIAAVPEPASVWLLVAMVVCLGGRRRR